MSLVNVKIDASWDYPPTISSVPQHVYHTEGLTNPKSSSIPTKYTSIYLWNAPLSPSTPNSSWNITLGGLFTTTPDQYLFSWHSFGFDYNNSNIDQIGQNHSYYCNNLVHWR
eukprot:1005555_1